jgi:hypothetical protein
MSWAIGEAPQCKAFKVIYRCLNLPPHKTFFLFPNETS